MSVRLFRTKASETLEKSLGGGILKKNGETETKRVLDYLRMRKQQEILTAVSIVCHRYQRPAVLQNVFAIILIWTRKDVEKLFEETVYKWDKENEKKQRRKEAFGTYTMPKLA